ncbi:MAG: hypothetical protein IJT98_08140 [Prevotella sp.]|nr:hypothetical protein [Prevotella sp.]
MKKTYKKPNTISLFVGTQNALMAGSVNEKTSGAQSMSTGSFGARGTASQWEDDEE